jgi:hypothetical protein
LATVLLYAASGGATLLHPGQPLSRTIFSAIGSGGIKQQERGAVQSSASNAEISNIYIRIVNF